MAQVPPGRSPTPTPPGSSPPTPLESHGFLQRSPRRWKSQMSVAPGSGPRHLTFHPTLSVPRLQRGARGAGGGCDEYVAVPGEQPSVNTFFGWWLDSSRLEIGGKPNSTVAIRNRYSRLAPLRIVS